MLVCNQTGEFATGRVSLQPDRTGEFATAGEFATIPGSVCNRTGEFATIRMSVCNRTGEFATASDFATGRVSLQLHTTT